MKNFVEKAQRRNQSFDVLFWHQCPLMSCPKIPLGLILTYIFIALIGMGTEVRMSSVIGM